LLCLPLPEIRRRPLRGAFSHRLITSGPDEQNSSTLDLEHYSVTHRLCGRVLFNDKLCHSFIALIYRVLTTTKCPIKTWVFVSIRPAHESWMASRSSTYAKVNYYDDRSSNEPSNHPVFVSIFSEPKVSVVSNIILRELYFFWRKVKASFDAERQEELNNNSRIRSILCMYRRRRRRRRRRRHKIMAFFTTKSKTNFMSRLNKISLLNENRSESFHYWVGIPAVNTCNPAPPADKNCNTEDGRQDRVWNCTRV